jgi:2-iminoacetate synthase
LLNTSVANHDQIQIIDHDLIYSQLEPKIEDSMQIDEILEKASELKGLNSGDILVLSNISTHELLQKLFKTAEKIKNTIYGKRLVLFAPLYISNLCQNECAYCAFRATNTSIQRRSLTQSEIEIETKHLLNTGNKRLLLVAGESYTQEGFEYILKSIDTVYNTECNGDNIRRLNVNIAPLTDEQFALLKQKAIGTYQLFQETYHKPTYNQVHLKGKKTDYHWRITAIDRAINAGIDDVGIGVLFGLAPWRFELLALMQHIRYLEKIFGIGPHTISVPRLEPAAGSELSENPPHPVSDLDFQKIIAILRLAVPYTGIIMSTRENPDVRRKTFALGVSQISAGSRTNPGGYSNSSDPNNCQFSLGDHRSLDEVIYDIIKLEYIPSFCTGCYRLGRTGHDFMDLAKPGKIKEHCEPNAILTFMEYIIDHASPKTKQLGRELIDNTIKEMPSALSRKTQKLLDRVMKGERDIFC